MNISDLKISTSSDNFILEGNNNITLVKGGEFAQLPIGIKIADLGSVPVKFKIEYKDLLTNHSNEMIETSWMKVEERSYRSNDSMLFKKTKSSSFRVVSENDEITRVIDLESILDLISKKSGSEIEGYTISRKLGSGGFADVFLAQDTEGNNVAIKVPHVSVLEEFVDKVKKKFLSEAANWQKLYSNQDIKQGIVGIYSYKIDPSPHILMEYMDKGNLRTNLPNMDFSHKTKFLESILNTLYDVHYLGMIHRDIKPENILLNSKEEWKIADWGLSKVLLESGSSTTQSGAIKATLSYAAPEQVDAGKYGLVDRRTDIYQVGAMAYEMFTGEKLFVGEPAKVVYSIMSKEPIHPCEANSKVPKELGDIIMRAVSKKKKDRWRDAFAFMESVRDLSVLPSDIK